MRRASRQLVFWCVRRLSGLIFIQFHGFARIARVYFYRFSFIWRLGWREARIDSLGLRSGRRLSKILFIPRRVPREEWQNVEPDSNQTDFHNMLQPYIHANQAFWGPLILLFWGPIKANSLPCFSKISGFTINKNKSKQSVETECYVSFMRL